MSNVTRLPERGTSREEFVEAFCKTVMQPPGLTREDMERVGGALFDHMPDEWLKSPATTAAGYVALTALAEQRAEFEARLGPRPV